MSTYQLIGTIVAERPKRGLDDALKRAVQEKACPVGADMAAINLITRDPMNGVQSANTRVYRVRRDESAPKSASAPVPM